MPKLTVEYVPVDSVKPYERNALMDQESKTAAEKQRLMSLLFSCQISKERIELLSPVIDNTVWMKAKLDEARELIRNASVAIPYDNGGGQTGIRENPLFKGYEALWKSYMSGVNAIMAALPREVVEKEAEEIEPPKSVLQLVRDKHRRDA